MAQTIHDALHEAYIKNPAVYRDMAAEEDATVEGIISAAITRVLAEHGCSAESIPSGKSIPGILPPSSN